MSAIATDIDDDRLVTQALLRAREALGLTLADLAGVVGVSEPTMKGYSRGAAVIRAPKTRELALGLIRVYRALFAILDGDTQQMRHWMATPNRHFRGAAPRELARSYTGLAELNSYLDVMRGRL